MLVRQMTVPDSTQPQAARSRSIFQIWMHSRHSNWQRGASMNLLVPIQKSMVDPAGNCGRRTYTFATGCKDIRGDNKSDNYRCQQPDADIHIVQQLRQRHGKIKNDNKLLDTLGNSRRLLPFVRNSSAPSSPSSSALAEDLQIPALGK